MAVLNLGSQGDVVRVWGEGTASFAALYALRKVSTGDTVDLSPDFDPPIRGVFLGVTLDSATAASISGNIVTIPGGDADAAFLLVYGVHA